MSSSQLAQGLGALSFLLLLTACITTTANIKNAGMLSYGWTDIFGVNAARDPVCTMYQSNTDTSEATLANMHRDAMDSAYCKPVDYGGQLIWKESDVSPLCRCLSIAIREYEKAVCPRGMCLDKNAMDSEENKFKRKWLTEYTFSKCFRKSRQTQVEDLMDPLTHSGSSSYTNTAAVAMYWNSMGTISILMLAATEQYHDNLGSEMSWLAWIMPFFIFVAALLSVTSIGFVTGSQGAAFTVPCILLGGIVLIFYLMRLRKTPAKRKQDALPEKLSEATTNMMNLTDLCAKALFWISYTCYFPVVLLACNMVMQRRHWFYNLQTVFTGAGIGLGMCAAEMVYSAATNILDFKATEKAQGDKVSLQDAGVILANSDSERKKKSSIIMDILSVVVLQIIVIFFGEFPTFPASSFSNAQKSASVVMGLLLLLPVAQAVRLCTVNPQVYELSVKNRGSALTALIMLSAVELLARFVYTFAVMYDLRGLSQLDNTAVA